MVFYLGGGGGVLRTFKYLEALKAPSKMPNPVQLPEGDFLTVYQIANAIADALHPKPSAEVVEVLIQNAQVVAHDVRGAYSESPLTDDQGNEVEADLNGFDGLVRCVGSHGPYFAGELTDEQVAELKKKWGNQVPDRCNWRPVLEARSNLDIVEREQEAVIKAHLKAIGLSIQEGELVAINDAGARERLDWWSADVWDGIGVCDVRIQRKDVVAYVLRAGLVVGQVTPTELSTQATTANDAVFIGATMNKKTISLPMVEWVTLTDIELAVKNAAHPLPTNFRQPDHHFKDGGYTEDRDSVLFYKFADARNSVWQSQYDELARRVIDRSIRAVDENNGPIKTLHGTHSGGVFIPRIDVVAYLEGYGFEVAGAAETPTPPSTEGTGGKGAGWIDAAQKIAREYIAETKKIDTYPSQQTIADHVAKKLRTNSIFGVSGKPLTGESVKRHALKGISSAKPLNPKNR